MSLKKIYKCMIALFIILCCNRNVSASSSGYYYENIDVQVEVNEKREFRITETLDVYYEEEMHGIIRSIPDSSDVEGYVISDVSVEGAPFQVEDTSSGIDIRIGDPDKTVKGKMRYVLSYTLEHYQDYDQEHDYIYLNLIGDDFDSPIHHLTAHVSWPEDAIFEKLTLTNGYSGSKDNTKLHYVMEDHGVSIESTQMINAYEAATIQVQFDQGAFAQAPVYVFPYIVNQREIIIQVDTLQDFYVTQKIDLTLNQDVAYFSLAPDFKNYTGHIQVNDFECMVDGEAEDSIYYAYLYDEGQHTIEMKYVLHPKTIIDGDLKLSLLDYSEDAQTENLYFEISMPVDIQYDFFLGRYNDQVKPERYEANVNENKLILTTKDVLQAAERADVTLHLSKNDFYRPIPLMIMLVPLLSIVLFIAVIVIRFFVLKSHFVEPVMFYPPEGINSAEAGYLIDGRASNEDMTSLIFYWASLGAIKIKGIDEEFTLVKEKELPEECRGYEHVMFKEMFNYGVNDEVTAEDLKNKFYVDIDVAKQQIANYYKKDMPLYDSSIKKLKWLMAILAIALMFLMSYAISIYESKSSWMVMSIIKTIMLSPMFIFVLFIILIRKILLKSQNTVLNVVFGLMILIPLGITVLMEFTLTEVYQKQFMIVVIFCLLSLFFTLGMKKYTQKACELIGQLRGFKTFLQEAEKEQLEMLLEEDPEYYYHILPYAQALHVTKIWQKKFEDLTMVPPSYHEGEVMNYDAFNSFSSTITDSMRESMSAPVSSDSSSDGGYSGGDGGFSDGGSSGGGSGGGGSHGW